MVQRLQTDPSNNSARHGRGLEVSELSIFRLTTHAPTVPARPVLVPGAANEVVDDDDDDDDDVVVDDDDDDDLDDDDDDDDDVVVDDDDDYYYYDDDDDDDDDDGDSSPTTMATPPRTVARLEGWWSEAEVISLRSLFSSPFGRAIWGIL